MKPETDLHRSISPERLVGISNRLMRAAFEAQPPRVQAETIARVRDRLRDERALNRLGRSALWQCAKAVYGVDPEEERHGSE